MKGVAFLLWVPYNKSRKLVGCLNQLTKTETGFD